METLPKTHILVVDDDLETLDLVCRILNRLGYETSRAVSGSEALARLAGGDGIHLMLTDINMPRMNGWELARRVKADRPRLPIVALTGESPMAILPRISSSGIAHAVFKPLRLEEFQRTLRDVLKSVPLGGGAAEGGRPPPDRGT